MAKVSAWHSYGRKWAQHRTVYTKTKVVGSLWILVNNFQVEKGETQTHTHTQADQQVCRLRLDSSWLQHCTKKTLHIA